MKIIHNKILPTKGFKAINLFGIIFVRRGLTFTPTDALHEMIHTKQMIEMLFIFFYIWYLIEWLVRLCIYRNATLAYLNISFEREAYFNQKNFNYLKERKLFSWRFYLKSKQVD